jgi:hypothetical protein
MIYLKYVWHELSNAFHLVAHGGHRPGVLHPLITQRVDTTQDDELPGLKEVDRSYSPDSLLLIIVQVICALIALGVVAMDVFVWRP